jgi:hypothetical protein
MPYMVTSIEVGDYEQWKEMFDKGRDTVRRSATGHRILRGVEAPGDLHVQVEFASSEDALRAREELLASGALDHVTVKAGPMLVESAEDVAY